MSAEKRSAVHPGPVVSGQAAPADEPQSLAMLLWARAYLYTLCQRVFGGQPDERLLSCVASDGSWQALGAFAEADACLGQMQTYAASLGDRLEDATFLWEAEAEHARFFDGPGALAAYPWESAYVNDAPVDFSENSLQVRAAYEACGLKAARQVHVPDDHVALMCGFMAELAVRLADSLEQGRVAEAQLLAESQAAFVRAHMLTWLDAYAAAACHEQHPRLVPQCAKMLAAFVNVDASLLGELLVLLDSEEVREGSDLLSRLLDEGRDDVEVVKLGLQALQALDLKFGEESELVPLS